MDYLTHGVAWGTVQRMLIDAPGWEDDETGKGEELDITLTDDNAKDVLRLINRINRQ